MEGDMYRNILVTFHTSMSHEMFSCVFSTKIPGFAARNGVFTVSVHCTACYVSSPRLT